MRKADYALAPDIFKRSAENAINNDGMKFRMRFGYRYKARHEPYLQGLLLTRELAANWQRVGTFGSYDLYRKER